MSAKTTPKNTDDSNANEVDVPRLVRRFRDVYELRLSAAEGRANLFEKAGNRTLAAIELGKAEAYKQVLDSNILAKLSQANVEVTQGCKPLSPPSCSVVSISVRAGQIS